MLQDDSYLSCRSGKRADGKNVSVASNLSCQSARQTKPAGDLKFKKYHAETIVLHPKVFQRI